MTQASSDLGVGRILLFDVVAGTPQFAAELASPATDEVVLAAADDTVYASQFGAGALLRARRTNGHWNSDGLHPLGGEAAGTDRDGEGRIIVTGFRDARVYVVTPSTPPAAWSASTVRAIAMAGTIYELCADPRPGAHWAWAVAQDGRAYAFDTRSATVLDADLVAPVDADGLAMSCHGASGTPYLVSEGNLWTWGE